MQLQNPARQLSVINVNPTQRFLIRPYTTKELAGIYTIGEKTFRKWIKPIELSLGKRIGHYYSVRQVVIIFDFLGMPYEVVIEE